MTTVLIGGYTGDKGSGSGITVLDGDRVVRTVPAESPSWIARHPRLLVLYAVAEIDEGRVHAWSLADGQPARRLGSAHTGGAEPAHLTVDTSGRFLITANYSGGSISVHQLGDDGRIGQRTDLVQHEAHGDHPRQEGPHPHMIRTIEGGLAVIDLGGDAIYRYRLSEDGTLGLDDVTATPARSGPRHLLEVGGRYYVTAELSGELLIYDRHWRLAGVVPATKADGHNQPSELASNGSYLYLANRGPDTVAVFALEGDLPRYVTEVPAGSWPRHIALDGDQLYVANERSHEVMRMRVDPETGIPALVQTIEVPSPTVVLP